MFELQIQEMFLTKNVFSRYHEKVVIKPVFCGRKGEASVQEALAQEPHPTLSAHLRPSSH